MEHNTNGRKEITREKYAHLIAYLLAYQSIALWS